MRLFIKDNKILAGLDLDTNQPVEQVALQRYQAIDELFAWIGAAKATIPERLDVVEYDARFGYPSKIIFDNNARPVDGGFVIVMRSLKKLRE